MPKNRKYFQNEQDNEVDEFYRRIAIAHARVDQVERDLFFRNVAGGFIEPDLINGFAQPAPPISPFSYRIWTGHKPQWRGHLDVSGATSPSAAFNIPLEELDMVEDHYWHSIVTDTVTFQSSMIQWDSTTGDVIFTWPSS